MQAPSAVHAAQFRPGASAEHAVQLEAWPLPANEQEYPTSTPQLESHPSPEMRFPSSQLSSEAQAESPQVDAHVWGEEMEPPTHRNPPSTMQLEEQPSPSAVLPSSHASSPHEINLPSPQTVEQLLSIPTPEPQRSSASVPPQPAAAHSQPASIWHRASQPSRGLVLPSSQPSMDPFLPSPHTCTMGT